MKGPMDCLLPPLFGARAAICLDVKGLALVCEPRITDEDLYYLNALHTGGLCGFVCGIQMY